MSKSNPPEILKFQENLNLNLNLPESLQKAKGFLHFY